ncbi:redoxin domain-containing protein [Myxococcus sp. RHSTA-1-4]|uniref:redoxin domain-containing protein n=1 Tax=Myxococcus sp. RHSTA-1-4 TaxID=2874601 RepID=UPI001CC1037D|nr:redoxin domain-containing protein [Myxococcus sp. RHSTA-1-4]MBZ4421961.1 redoxin family protein [Myxococcus sp. RHSTA-1-4]
MASSDRVTGTFLGVLVLAWTVGCATTSSGPTRPVRQLLLEQADGSTVPLGQVLDPSEATVLVFWSTSCPCVRRYQARVEALHATYATRGVGVVAVDSNADDSLEELVRVARARGVTVPVLRDPGAVLADAVGARSTPTVVLVRRDGSVLFHGWMDNEREPGEPGREAYLEEAIEGFLARRSFPARSPFYGCAITRSLRTGGGNSSACGHAGSRAAVEPKDTGGNL